MLLFVLTLAYLQSDGIALPSLFIYGHTATGKSVAIKYVLRKVTVSLINCGKSFKSSSCFDDCTVMLMLPA
jgi:Cdc6-like AAA superfamily ATPase